MQKNDSDSLHVAERLEIETNLLSGQQEVLVSIGAQETRVAVTLHQLVDVVLKEKKHWRLTVSLQPGRKESVSLQVMIKSQESSQKLLSVLMIRLLFPFNHGIAYAHMTKYVVGSPKR